MICELYEMMRDNFFGVISLLIQGFIAYHIFFLGKKLSTKNKLQHTEWIEEEIREHLGRIRNEGIRRKIYLVNIDNYYSKYPNNYESIFSNYSHIRAELKGLRFDGVEFFTSMQQEIFRCNGKLYKTNRENCTETIRVFPVGIIPHEKIFHFNFHGDDFNGSPLVFCKFKGKIWWRKSYPFFSREPYTHFVYYKTNPNFDENNDPSSFEYIQITEKIYN